MAVRSSLLGVAALCVVAGLLAPAASAAARPHGPPHALRAGQTLAPGGRLVSANGRWVARVRHARLTVSTRHGHRVWAGGRATGGSALRISPHGLLELTAHGRTTWSAHTYGSGAHDVLRMGNHGVLTLSGRGGDVWTSRLGSHCSGTGPHIDVGLGAQLMRVCQGGQQLRVSRVTTGATDRGDGTPTGTWHVQGKVRNTTLYPAAGGAYPVKFWMPYDGAYGLHDASWQKFPYGSGKYQRHGSHGCVHVPLATMRWVFDWARVGTTAVAIHR